MADTHTNPTTGGSPADRDAETEAVLEEVIDASLHSDRAHHDELGRTQEPVEPDRNTEEAPPSPREQPAAAIDIRKVDE